MLQVFLVVLEYLQRAQKYFERLLGIKTIAAHSPQTGYRLSLPRNDLLAPLNVLRGKRAFFRVTFCHEAGLPISSRLAPAPDVLDAMREHCERDQRDDAQNDDGPARDDGEVIHNRPSD